MTKRRYVTSRDENALGFYKESVCGVFLAFISVLASFTKSHKLTLRTCGGGYIVKDEGALLLLTFR